MKENEDIALLFLDKNFIDLNKGWGFSGSTLHLAVNKLMVRAVKRLLLQGASITVLDEKGRTPFMMLFEVFNKDKYKAWEIADIFIKRNSQNPVNPNQLDFEHLSILGSIIRKGIWPVLLEIIRLNRFLH